MGPIKKKKNFATNIFLKTILLLTEREIVFYTRNHMKMKEYKVSNKSGRVALQLELQLESQGSQFKFE